MINSDKIVCMNCRYYLKMSGERDDDCININSPKYDIGISEFDKCPEFTKKENA